MNIKEFSYRTASIMIIVALLLTAFPLGLIQVHAANPGDVVINEIMQNPAAVADAAGEWLELYNPTSAVIDIEGWTILDNDIDSHVIANGGPLIIPAGGYLVLGNNADTGTNGGAPVAYSYGSAWFLANGADEVVLLDAASNEIDRVEYDDGATFPDPTGASMALIDPALDNNIGANWCTASTPYGDGDLGTPGLTNDCGAPPPPFASIYNIQFTTDPGGDSPYVGQVVTTQGIVTAVLYNGYWVEDAAGGPWSGLWVYNSSAPSLGDLVRLTGDVVEYSGLTELTNLSEYAVVTSGNPLPNPVVLSTAAVSDEQYESVLVRVENVTVTNPDLGYGEWSVSDGSGDVVIDDKGSYTYVPAGGDTLTAIIGPLDYGYGAFKIQPRDDNDIVFTLPPPALVINEILADPAGDLTGDANGDGTRDSGQDEFVEIVNNSDDDMDISGWTLADGYSVRHTFPAGTVVSARCAVVVFGGGTPTGAFGNTVVQTASTGQLGLNNSGDTVTLNNGSTDQAVVVYGAEGGYDQSLTRDPDITGSFVQHSTATGSEGALFSPGTMVNISLFAGCPIPEVCGDPFTQIYDVQGSGYESPLIGQIVSIEGIVTGDFQGGDALSGFTMQDPVGDGDAATSDGIFVYDESNPLVDVSAGEHVRVRGQVAEYYEMTQISYVELVLSCGTGSVAATQVDMPVAVDLEPVEGMLITFPEEMTASQNYFQGRYGQVTMSSGGRMYNPTNTFLPESDEAVYMADENNRRMIILDDGTTSQNPNPIPYIGTDNTLRAGDTVSGLTGIVDFGPINSTYPYARHYRLHPTEPVEFVRLNHRTPAPEDTLGLIKIASFNVLNYFNGDGMGGGFPTSRGATTVEEFIRQRDKIIPAIIAMNADVIGLMEIENDGYDEYSAIQDLVNGLNNVSGPGQNYAFIDPGVDPIGTDEIAVGFIYNTQTVVPVGTAAILDSSVDPDFNSDYNRPAIAQTFERLTGGGRFTAAVNHLKSKGSDCDDLGDPDIGDGQGNCNLTRTSAAIALADWLAGDPTSSGDSDFFIIGDLNSYAMEDPITALEDFGFTNLVKQYLGAYTYSYTFDGLAGYLDHGLGSGSASYQTFGSTIWHINTDEPSVIDYNTEYKPQDLYEASPNRSSDHDPVIIGFCEAEPPMLDVRLSRDTLWPPDHKLKPINAFVEVSDNLDPAVQVELVSITSNEPDNGLGDGDQADDIVIDDDFFFRLRAERSGVGGGRVYTITYKATDSCGNVTFQSVFVTVPHSVAKRK